MDKYAILDVRTRELAEGFLAGARVVSPGEVGLDPRSFTAAKIGPDYLAVPEAERGSLEHYASFWHVGRDYVTVFGGWVFYAAADRRVAECLERLAGGN